MLAAEDSCFDLVGPRQHGTANNRPFATSDHMVQVMIFWRKRNVRDSTGKCKQRKLTLF